MASDIGKIKALRDETGLSFDKIKKAFDEANGDDSKVREILASYGSETAEKKSSREVKEGIVEAYIHGNKKVGAMVSLLCETDFVARNDEFRILAKELAMQIAAMRPVNSDDLLIQPYIKDPQLTVKDLVNQSVAKLGENIQIGRFEIFEL